MEEDGDRLQQEPSQMMTAAKQANGGGRSQQNQPADHHQPPSLTPAAPPPNQSPTNRWWPSPPASTSGEQNATGAGGVGSVQSGKQKRSTAATPKVSTTSSGTPKFSTNVPAGGWPPRLPKRRTISEHSSSGGSAGGGDDRRRNKSKQSSGSRAGTTTSGLNRLPPKRTTSELRRAVLLANAEHSAHPTDGLKPHAMSAFRRLSRADFPFKRASDRIHMNSVKQIMEKFERHSTIHGICHASLAPNKRWRRFWLAVFAVCFMILVIQVIYLIIKFFGYPKTVDLDLKFENAPFPSVTVCNLNPYKVSAIQRDKSVQATMNAFQNILEETGRSEGVAAAIASASAVRRKRRQLQRKARETKNFARRYLQVYAQCYCELSRLSAERRRGSCFAAYKGNVSLSFGVDSQLHNYHPTKCLCQLDWITKTLWPCFPHNTWKEHICTECVDQLGHCPMRFPAYTMATTTDEQNVKATDGQNAAAETDEQNVKATNERNGRSGQTETNSKNNDKNKDNNGNIRKGNGRRRKNEPSSLPGPHPGQQHPGEQQPGKRPGQHPGQHPGQQPGQQTGKQHPGEQHPGQQQPGKRPGQQPGQHPGQQAGQQPGQQHPGQRPGEQQQHKPEQRRRQVVDMVQNLEEGMDLCMCHPDYNHCVQNNINGEVPEVLPTGDLNALNFMQNFVDSRDDEQQWRMRTTTTTQAPDIVQAMGFEELKDEIAIKSRARENLMYAVEEKPKEERIKLSQQKDELILKCSFNQYDCSITKDFKLFYDPTYGNCYTFNWDRDAHVTAHRAGANYGLRVMLYANVSEYLPTSEAVGFRITVHDKWTVPFADAFGYNAPTGFMSSFGVRMKKFFRLEPPYGHCSEGGENSESYIYKGYSYSIEGCHRSCTQNEVIRICGCADPLYPVPQNAHSCKVVDPVARDCIKNTSRMLADLIATGALKDCKCHQPCRETAYEVTYSAARWPSGTTKLMECDSSDNLCMEKYRTNAAMVQVFYEELNYETLSESVAYSMTSLFADLGGLTGLWIGISVVSVLEVFQLIWFCLDFRRSKKKQQQQVVTTVQKTSSASSSLQRASMRSRKSTKSSMKAGASLPCDIVPPVSVVIQEETDEDEPPPPATTAKSRSSSRSSSPSPKYSTGRYLAPGEDLPCTCLYGQRGQIVFMKPLCPFHGYMVRRCSSIYSSNDEEAADDGERPPRHAKGEEGSGNESRTSTTSSTSSSSSNAEKTAARNAGGRGGGDNAGEGGGKRSDGAVPAVSRSGVSDAAAERRPLRPPATTAPGAGAAADLSDYDQLA